MEKPKIRQIFFICILVVLVKISLSIWFWQYYRPLLRQKLPKIFCFVMTSSPFRHRIAALYETWLPRCDGYEFHTDSPLARPYPHVVLHNYTSRGETWRKLRASLRYLNRTKLDYEWFVRSCDDSYFLVENLRAFLHDKNPDELHYYGYAMKWPNITFAAGSGIVLSRATLRLLVNELLESGKYGCKEESTSEDDVRLAICLNNVGIKVENSLDDKGLQRFHHDKIENHIAFNLARKAWFSPTAIMFHYLTVDQIRLLDILLYSIDVDRNFAKLKKI